MPDIKNLGYGSLAIQLPEGKQVVLGPRETANISPTEFESEAVNKLLNQGLITALSGDAAADKKPNPAKPNQN